MPNQVLRQRDFSGGELVEHAKRRDDEPAVRAGSRKLRNWRILSSGAVENRPGRTALFAHDGRVDHVRVSPLATYWLCFGDGTLTIRDDEGAPVARAWGYDWTPETADQIVWALALNDVVICFPGQRTKVARWDGDDGWTFLDFAFDENSIGQRRAPFYRLSRKGVTLLPSAVTGTIDITFSDDVLTDDHVGTRLRYAGRQMTVETVVDAQHGTALVNETLSDTVNIAFPSGPDVRKVFFPGDLVEGTVSGAKGIVSSIPSALALRVIVTFGQFVVPDAVIGPNGTNNISTTNVSAATSEETEVWDDEVVNDFRGWPQSVTFDQNRLIFCDFPGLPAGMSWSAIATANEHYSGGVDETLDAADAFFELAPKKARVLHVMDGADEFVITDLGVYYIPISESNPLRPGSVVLRRIPGPAAASVRPVSSAQGVLYVGAGQNRVVAIVATGQTAQPWLARPVSDLHSHLFSGVRCLAVEDGISNPPEERVYAVNSDGSLAIGRYQPGKEWVGWLPWSGEGEVQWASSLAGEVLLLTDYEASSLVERIDTDQYLDGAVPVDDIPDALASGDEDDILLHDEQGDAIGSMSSAGGLAAAFDGTTSQAAAAAASRTAATTGAVGKTFGQAFCIAKAEVWPSSDAGFTDQANFTLSLRAKQGDAPSDYASEGTELATTGELADATTMRTLTSSDTTTEWDHAWVLLTISTGITYIAEVRFYSPGETHGDGDLWFLAGATVELMDGLRYLGEREVDADGELVPIEGDDLEGEDLTIGFSWDATLEPFLAHAGPGQSAGQSMHERQIANCAVAVQQSTGYLVETIKNDEAETATFLGRQSPYRQGENEDADPPLREEVKVYKPTGQDFDPRVRLTKDAPGPLRVLEVGVDIAV